MPDARRLAPAIAVLALVPLLVEPSAAARRLRCPGAFQRSCVRAVYRGFDGQGACTRDVTRYLTEGRITDCWANGAYATATGFLGDGTVEVYDSRGRRVRAGRTSDGQLAGALTLHYRKGRRRWSIARAIDGTWTITCPSKRVETYGPDDVRAGGCGPIAECRVGACPRADGPGAATPFAGEGNDR